jgi:hypothetical protein
MYCGGNQLIPEGGLEASRIEGLVTDGHDGVFPNAQIQVQAKGRTDILLERIADQKGQFKLPALRPGQYWLGVSIRGFNLHYWDLTVKRGSGAKVLQVTLTPGT